MNDTISVFWAILIVWSFIALSMMITIVFINQKFGFEIIEIFTKHSLTKLNKLQLVIKVWIIYLIISVITFIVQSAIYRNSQIILGSFGDNLVIIPVITSILFISWMILVGFSGKIKIVRNNLTNIVVPIRTYQLTHANKFLHISYKSIEKIDHLLDFAFIFSAFGIMMTIMSLVYLGLFANKVPYATFLIIFSLPNITLQFII